ncbi:MAG: BF3164 family lipoprotein [Bacteroidales bacterium]
MNFFKKIKREGILIIGVLMVSLTSCKKRESIVLHENITSFTKFPMETDVVFKNLFEYKDGEPRTLQLLDSTLIIFNFTKKIESFFYNYNLKSNKLSKGYLKKGRGPNEAIGAACTGIVDDNLWVYDVTKKKIFTIDKSSALYGNEKLFQSYPVEDNFYQITLIGNSKFLASGKANSKYKIQEIDFSGKLQKEFGEFKYIPKDVPTDALKDACHSFFYLKPSGDKVAIPYLFTDIMEIYNIAQPSPNIAVQGPHMVNMDFEVGKRGDYNFMKKNNEIRKTFLSGAVTDKYIYLAYSGLSYAEREDMNYCKYVYVFDWDGNPIKKLNLNKRILGLAVSNDETIYSYDVDSGFIVKAEI